MSERRLIEHVPLVGWTCPHCWSVTDEEGVCFCATNLYARYVQDQPTVGGAGLDSDPYQASLAACVNYI